MARRDKLKMLMKRVTVSPSQCWLWQGATDRNGYGRVSKITYGESLAHRAIFKLTGHTLQMYLCHKCDNPSCVNPDHMFEGTQRDNLADAKSKGRRLGEIPKISDETIELVKAAVGAGSTQRSISRTFSVSEATVSRIKTNTQRT